MTCERHELSTAFVKLFKTSLMYLLDTDTVIFFFKGKYDIDTSIQVAGPDNCFISEITLAELLFGAAKSNHPDQRRAEVMQFIEEIRVLPISGALDVYAAERARLENEGKKIDDFDLLIGATAVANTFKLVTHNTKHFERLDSIVLEDWTKTPLSITQIPNTQFQIPDEERDIDT